MKKSAQIIWYRTQSKTNINFLLLYVFGPNPKQDNRKKNFAILGKKYGNGGFTFHIKLFSFLSVKKNLGEMKKSL